MTAFKKLREIITFKGGGTPSKQIPEYWNGSIPWATVKDFTSTSLERTQDFISELGLHNSSSNMIPKGHVIIPTRMSLGKAAINKIDLAINQDLRALIPQIPLDERYLLHAILSLKDEIVNKGSGATVKGITQESLYSLKVFLPPIDDQKRIAHLLGKVEGLIARRKQHPQQLDDLLKSVFLEMFGDPARNEKGWAKKMLSKFCDFENGDRSSNYPSGDDIQDAGVLFLSSREIVNFRLVLSDSVFISEGKFNSLSRGKCYPGDVLLVLRGAGLGKCCVFNGVHDKAFINAQMVILRCNENLNNAFLVEQIKNERMFRELLKVGTGSAQPQLTASQVKQFKVITPPINLQKQFAAIVEKVEGLKSHYQQSLANLESLYGVLSQKAFKGELDLSRVSLPVEKIADDMDGTGTHRKTKPLERGFARQLLAAEILYRYNHHGMTQMKLQKLIHLAEYHAHLDEVQGEYQRQAAGPFDNQMMYGIAAGLKKQQWFEIHGKGQRATYSPLSKAGSHEKYLLRWHGNMPKIDEVLQLLGKARPDQCEIVSTLYAAWNDLLIDGTKITDETIIEQASKAGLWHKTKEAINPARWPKALQWMRDHNLVPTGYGKHTRKLK